MKAVAVKPPMVIPVENQVRELDSKLLLACIAAQRGFTSIIGSHREIDLRIASLPRSIYLCKSMTNRNLKMFQIMHRLGHLIVTWDEEALVHLPPETYYSRRLCPVTIRFLAHLFAWGEDNAELWRQYPDTPDDMPIHVTGNPRGDLLRPEVRMYYQVEADALKKKYGAFVLVNTNFNHVNAFFPAQNLFRPMKDPSEPPTFGKAAVGMSREYAEGLRDHKQVIFEAFQELIPNLDQGFPDHNFIVRPHPTENQDIYRRIAQKCKRVRVTNKGNIVPWLMATQAVIHNGCTTGVEAHMLNVPAVSYRAVVNDTYDMGFYKLPNLVSHQCFDYQQLEETLSAILAGNKTIEDGDERDALIRRYLAAQEGPLACEKIMDVLEDVAHQYPQLPSRGAASSMIGWLHANGRRLIKRTKAYLPGTHAPPEFHKHRYPGISREELQEQIRRFQQILGDNTPIKTKQLYDQIFMVRV